MSKGKRDFGSKYIRELYKAIRRENFGRTPSLYTSFESSILSFGRWSHWRNWWVPLFSLL